MKEKKKIRPSDDKRVQDLANAWGTLARAGRGKILDPLLEDFTTRELAGALSCSEKAVRDCVDLSRTSSLKDKHHYSDNALLKIASAHRAFQKKWKKMSQEAAGKRLHRKLVRTLVKWFKENMGHPTAWEHFFKEQDNSPYARREVLCGGPWNYCQPDGDWEAIIKATRPNGNYLQRPWREYQNAVTMKDWGDRMAKLPAPDDYRATHWSLSSRFGFHRKWLGAWLARCVPDGRFAESALRDARRAMRHETKKVEAQVKKRDGCVL